MFILVPLIIFLSSTAIVIGMVSRKFTYLRKLTPEAINGSSSINENFWAELFPALASWFRKKNIQEFRVNFLAEFEKLLRKLRLISLRIDTFTNKLIHSVRKSAAHHEEVLTKETALAKSENVAATNASKKDWKEEEQKLIIEIAKNPKNALLYKELGDVYTKMGDNQDAYESFKKAFELNPEDTDIGAKLEKASKKIEKI